MSDSNAMTPERAALIDTRLGQAFNFVRDVIDDPRILEEIPTGSTLSFRDVLTHQYMYRIAAYRSEGDPQRWTARTLGRTPLHESPDHYFWIAVIITSSVSAEAAMDSVESALRAAEDIDEEHDQASRQTA